MVHITFHNTTYKLFLSSITNLRVEVLMCLYAPFALPRRLIAAMPEAVTDTPEHSLPPLPLNCYHQTYQMIICNSNEKRFQLYLIILKLYVILINTWKQLLSNVTNAYAKFANCPSKLVTQIKFVRKWKTFNLYIKYYDASKGQFDCVFLTNACAYR